MIKFDRADFEKAYLLSEVLHNLRELPKVRPIYDAAMAELEAMANPPEEKEPVKEPQPEKPVERPAPTQPIQLTIDRPLTQESLDKANTPVERRI